MLAIGAALVSFGLFFFAVVDQVRTTIELYGELQSEGPKLERLKKKVAELEQITFTPEFAQAAIVDNALPSRKPLLELLTSLNTIAVANNVRVEDFSLSPGLVASNAAETVLANKSSGSNATTDVLESSISVLGTYADVSKFLIDVEKIVPFTTIYTMQLESRAVGDDFNQEETDMLARLKLKSHFFTQAVSAAVEAPLPVLSTKEQNVLAELSKFSNFDLPEQLQVTGGGLQDLFGVSPLDFE